MTPPPPKRMYRVTATGYVGSSIFSPNLRGERRTYEFQAESEDDVKRLFNEAVEQRVDGVMGTGPFKLETIEEIEDDERYED